MPSTHAKISYLKSSIRIFGYAMGALTGRSYGVDSPATTAKCLVICFVALTIAELLGIAEEFGL